MNAVEMELLGIEKKYEDGLLFPSDFCSAVVECLSSRCSDDYDLRSALTAKAIARVVQDMNVMKSASISGGPVLTVDSSATTHDHTAEIPSYLALAQKWQAAGWIELTTSEGVERWRPSEHARLKPDTR